jgi:NADP-dependent 3-hydroxy acid dehydrogenase YdfG
MIDTESKLQSNLVSGNPSPNHHLVNKVILLIGNDAGTLHSLAATFAAYGSDIALASSRLPVDTILAIRENVQQSGGRFLLLNRDLADESRSAESLISTVKKELGKMDILIDLSARDKMNSNSDNPQPRWWLSPVALQEFIR